MEWLNYHHLLYFWMVAKHGSITRASTELRLAHPTISGQIHRLEEVLGEKLFARSGRNLVLTDSGRIAFRYADEIFALGQEFQDTLKGRSTGQADAARGRRVRRDREVDRSSDPRACVSAARQGSHHLSGGSLGRRVHGRARGSCDRRRARRRAGRAWYAGPHVQPPTRRLRLVVLRRRRSSPGRCRKGFPGSLDGVPVLLPSSDSTFRRALDEWFQSHDIRPEIIAELDDLALASVLGEQGLGVLAAPDVIEKELRQRYALQLVGRAKDIRQRFFAISVERKIKNPAVAAICEVARKKIFA